MNEDARQEQEIASAWREAVAHEAPPPALDAKIRAAARAAPGVARRRPRYLAPLALAASVLVAVGLVLRQQRVATPPPMPAAVAPAPTSPQQAEPAKKAARAAVDSSASEDAARAPQAVAPPPPAAAAQSSPSPPTSPSTFARERRAEALHDFDAAAGAAARDATPDVVATIRTLLARGERDAAAALAREYVARRPSPPPLPADLRFLLDGG